MLHGCQQIQPQTQRNNYTTQPTVHQLGNGSCLPNIITSNRIIREDTFPPLQQPELDSINTFASSAFFTRLQVCAGAVAHVQDAHRFTRNVKQDALSVLASSIEKLPNFVVKRSAFWSQRAPFGKCFQRAKRIERPVTVQSGLGKPRESTFFQGQSSF